MDMTLRASRSPHHSACISEGVRRMEVLNSGHTVQFLSLVRCVLEEQGLGQGGVGTTQSEDVRKQGEAAECLKVAQLLHGLQPFKI